MPEIVLSVPAVRLHLRVYGVHSKSELVFAMSISSAIARAQIFLTPAFAYLDVAGLQIASWYDGVAH